MRWSLWLVALAPLALLRGAASFGLTVGGFPPQHAVRAFLSAPHAAETLARLNPLVVAVERQGPGERYRIKDDLGFLGWTTEYEAILTFHHRDDDVLGWDTVIAAPLWTELASSTVFVGNDDDDDLLKAHETTTITAPLVLLPMVWWQVHCRLLVVFNLFVHLAP
jgi:hypothetical protein